LAEPSPWQPLHACSRSQAMRPITGLLFVYAAATLHINTAASQVTAPVPVPAPESAQAETPEATDHRDPQLLIKVRVVEVSLTNMRVLGFDFATLERHPGRSTTTAPHEALWLVECDPKAINGLADAVTAENIAKVLAEPTIVTVAGRQASYFVGGEVPVSTENADTAKPTYRRIGTEVDITPTLMGKERLRMQVHTKITELDRSLETATAPGFRVREMNTQLDVDLGKTMAVGGPTQERTVFQKHEGGRTSSSQNTVQTLYLFTPEIVVAKAPSPLPR
jgi:hypothetical protein